MRLCVFSILTFFFPHITFIFVCKKSRILFNIICLCKSINHLSFHHLFETLFISTPFSHHLLQHVGLKAGNVLLTQGLFLLPFFNLSKAVKYQKVERWSLVRIIIMILWLKKCRFVDMKRRKKKEEKKEIK